MFTKEIKTPIGTFKFCPEINVCHKQAADRILLNQTFVLGQFTPNGLTKPTTVGWIDTVNLECDRNHSWVTQMYDLFVPITTKLYDATNGHNRNFEE